MTSPKNCWEGCAAAIGQLAQTQREALESLAEGDVATYFLKYHTYERQLGATIQGMASMPLTPAEHILWAQKIRESTQRISDLHAWVCDNLPQLAKYQGDA